MSRVWSLIKTLLTWVLCDVTIHPKVSEKAVSEHEFPGRIFTPRVFPGLLYTGLEILSMLYPFKCLLAPLALKGMGRKNHFDAEMWIMVIGSLYPIWL